MNNSRLLEQVRIKLGQLKSLPTERHMQSTAERPFDLQGGYEEYVVNLADVNVLGLPTFQRQIKGYGIAFMEGGSLVDFSCQLALGSSGPTTPLQRFRAGDLFSCRFDQFALYAYPFNVQAIQGLPNAGNDFGYFGSLQYSGQIRIIVFTTADALYQAQQNANQNRLRQQLIWNGQVAITQQQVSQKMYDPALPDSPTNPDWRNYANADLLTPDAYALNIDGARGMRFVVEMFNGDFLWDGGANDVFLALYWQPPSRLNWYPFNLQGSSSGNQLGATSNNGLVAMTGNMIPVAHVNDTEFDRGATPDIPVHTAGGRVWAGIYSGGTVLTNEADLRIIGYAWS